MLNCLQTCCSTLQSTVLRCCLALLLLYGAVTLRLLASGFPNFPMMSRGGTGGRGGTYSQYLMALGKSTQNGEGFSTWTSFCKVRKPSLCCIAHENRPDGQGSC